MYSPVALRTSTQEQLSQDRIRDELSPCEVLVGAIDADTPDQQVMELYELAGDIGGMRPEELAPKKAAL